MFNLPSLLFFVLLTVLAIYCLIYSIYLYFPMPKAITVYTVICPLLSGLITVLSKSTGRPRLPLPPIRPSTLRSILLLLHAGLAGIAFTFASDSFGLTCQLADSWQDLYRQKDSRRIRAIQDAFDCCGLRTVHDMPFPFPSAHLNIDVNTCAARFARERGCLVAWRTKEQRTAGLIVAVHILCVAYLWLVADSTEWNLRRFWDAWIPVSSQRQQHQRAISHENHEQYLDEPEHQREQEIGAV